MSNTKLTVNYIDSDTGSIIDSEIIVGEEVHCSQTSTVTAELKDIPSYVMTGWILTTPDGTQEASGQKDTIQVTLTEKTPHKILVVDCLKLKSDDGDSDDNDDIPVSNVSEAGARKIYTPVELPGTAEEPVLHEFEIYINGGGFECVEFCQKNYRQNYYYSGNSSVFDDYKCFCREYMGRCTKNDEGCV